MSDVTPRFGLPLLAAGQAQKELAHNEALTLIDLLIQPRVEAIGDNAPPGAPAPGQAWIVGASPTGAWAGHAAALASWTAGGWRFVAAREGMEARSGGAVQRYDSGTWSSGPTIDAPAGGSVIDIESRSAVTAIIATLRTAGLIPA